MILGVKGLFHGINKAVLAWLDRSTVYIRRGTAAGLTYFQSHLWFYIEIYLYEAVNGRSTPVNITCQLYFCKYL
jgi:hypothetical protein